MITGGPGVGKTAILEALASRGFEFVPEAAREIIRDRKRRNLSPRPSPDEFARAILRIDIERYRSAPASSKPVFFDRGVPDALGMLEELGLLTPREIEKNLAAFPYFKKVFVPPPWAEIYRTDEERDQSFTESVRVHDSVSSWYRRCGYEVVHVPHASVEERCAFILGALNP